MHACEDCQLAMKKIFSILDFDFMAIESKLAYHTLDNFLFFGYSTEHFLCVNHLWVKFVGFLILLLPRNEKYRM